ncbi:hypothetical protein EB796_002041 [Bugula neritina]|uniref:Uncharacterized protein n=1 Tax=Bugula neritina TaxID=10212 RepID=A0A7J7KNB3_BUGNE|nr:hypothetical protein EB796_002041 [Bugula neritina]
MSVETLELRCLSELQRQETNDSLSQEHQDTLDSIEEEVAACQKYLQYLETMPGGAEEKLPGVEHKVSKLQRMFQTLQLINPTLCEGSLVSEYLGQLMNDLQALQGRLEVIPEEGTFQSHGRELHTWQEHISENLNRQEDDSDQEFIESILAELAASLQTLLQSDQSDGSIQPALDFFLSTRSAICSTKGCQPR